MILLIKYFGNVNAGSQIKSRNAVILGDFDFE